jgi:hypothetical protein
MPFHDNFSLVQPSKQGASFADHEAHNLHYTILKQEGEHTTCSQTGPGLGAFACPCILKHIDYTCRIIL